jgi:hypothetical protein
MRYINKLVSLLLFILVFFELVTSEPIRTEYLFKPGIKEKFLKKATLVSLSDTSQTKITRSKQEVIYNDKPDVVNKDQIHNQRRYYKPNYVKPHYRFCDPYWRKPFKSVSFGFDI